MLTGTPVLAEETVEPKMAYVNTDKVYVRTGAGTTNTPLKFNGSDIFLYNGQYVQVVGTAKDTYGNTWDQITFKYYGHAHTGYMSADYVTEFSLDSQFETYLTEQGFPESYKPYLRALYEAFGKKWTFVAFKTGLDWNDTIEMESTLGHSLVDGSNTALRSTVEGAYNSDGTWKQFESGWYAASSSTVAFYMDPRNYLIDGTCFAFEKLSANESITFDQLKKAFIGYEWATDQIIQEFIDAGKAANVSPLFLASRAKQELGRAATTNASGYDVNGDGILYYNFFNIGAFGSDDPNLAGLVYASKTDESTGRPWDTSYKAILGGASFIAKSYIGKGQDSLYLQKFNVTSYSTYTHQYMTNVRAPYSEGWSSYKVYRDLGLLDTSFKLVIPIYENMPEEESPLPLQYDVPEVVSYDYVETLGLILTDANLSGIQEGTTANSLIEKVKAINSKAEVTICDKNGNIITDGSVGTGATITIKDDSGTMIYTFVLYGDANGDAHINALDLLYVKKHILKTELLLGVYEKAATLANNRVDALALLAIKKHILRIELINQQ
jgi:beta-N-acetylglucosaminidase